jgi:hypothetical protein
LRQGADTEIRQFRGLKQGIGVGHFGLLNYHFEKADLSERKSRGPSLGTELTPGYPPGRRFFLRTVQDQQENNQRRDYAQ